MFSKKTKITTQIFPTFGQNDNKVKEVDIVQVKLKCTNEGSISVEAIP